MRKGDQTKEYILHKAAVLFNERGYYGASMSDIMAATGLEKGGIYNHFKSKDDLAMQAFEYSVDLMRQEFAIAIKGKYHVIERLHAVMRVFEKIASGSLISGGCPVMNMAIQANTDHQLLQASARQTMQEWQEFIARITQAGMDRGQLQPTVDPSLVTTVIISTLEGAIMLTHLHGDGHYMDQAMVYLEGYLDSLTMVEV